MVNLPLGENIGDLSGVLVAYGGLQQHFKTNGKPEPIDGFTPEQRFFMSWATVWLTLAIEDSLRTQIKTDPQSPGRYRATQPLQNIDAFYEAFDIHSSDTMYLKPEDHVRI
jgi:putative endopeptidase